ncbi:MAG: hypothetical protein JWO57_1527, partial [Pseudonocardiales bacterium]|nr:hypothetical protein [Pseudonocardiales bacterium]
MPVTPKPITGSTQIPTPRVTLRSYLSTQHLYAARYAAEAAQAVEQEDHADPVASFIRHRGHVMSAVTESIAFLEAAINEIFQDAADGDHSYVG